MYTSPPQTIAPGTPVALDTPSNEPYAWVVVSNLSPYLLSVQAGVTGTSWLEPFTAMLYPTGSSHAPVTVQAQKVAQSVGIPAGGSQVQATWYTAGEEPVGTWPVSLTSQAIVESIASAGIAGASSLSTQVLPGATHGAATDFHTVFVPGTYRLWGWGWFPTSFAALDPTKGVIQVEFGAGLQGGAWDQLSYVEAASGRLNSLAFTITSSAGLIVSNYFDQDVDLFVNIGPA